MLARYEPYRDALLEAQAWPAKGREGAQDALFRAIVDPLPTEQNNECANYFVKAGYARTWRHPALACARDKSSLNLSADMPLTNVC